MELCKIPFFNHFTASEVEGITGTSQIERGQYYRFNLDLKNSHIAYFDFLPSENSGWEYKSGAIHTNAPEEMHEDIQTQAREFLIEKIEKRYEPHYSEIGNQEVREDRKLSPAQKDLIIKLSRPFLFPFNGLHSFLNIFRKKNGSNYEVEYLQNWRGGDLADNMVVSDHLLNYFMEEADADLNNTPEIIPVLYGALRDIGEGGIEGRVMEKIASKHDPDDPLRARLEAVRAIWEGNWTDYFSWYPKIPASMHHWDPVPRYFLTTAIYEGIEDWDAMLEALDRVTYYGGCPLYIIYSIKGCWEYNRGDFKAALASKQIACKSKISLDYLSIRWAYCIINFTDIVIQSPF